MANWTGAASGGLSGAATGATIGSIVPGIGTGIGAAVGGIIGAAGGLFGGKKKKKKVSSFDRRQKKINEEQYAALQGKGPLADIYNYNPEAANNVFDETVANPAYRNYKEKLAPEITGQFRKNGLMNSSYAGDALARTARDVQENLNAERSKYLYGQENETRSAKRQGIENYQNRANFSWDKNAKSGFDIDKVLSTITPEMTKQLSEHFKTKPKGK